jgi:hypothetical protein
MMSSATTKLPHIHSITPIPQPIVQAAYTIFPCLKMGKRNPPKKMPKLDEEEALAESQHQRLDEIDEEEEDPLYWDDKNGVCWWGIGEWMDDLIHMNLRIYKNLFYLLIDVQPSDAALRENRHFGGHFGDTKCQLAAIRRTTHCQLETRQCPLAAKS